jgi:hypothetical protein
VVVFAVDGVRCVCAIPRAQRIYPWLYVAKPKPATFIKLDAFFTPSSEKDRFRTRFTYKPARLSFLFWAGPYCRMKVSIRPERASSRAVSARSETRTLLSNHRASPVWATLKHIHRCMTRGRVLFSLSSERRFYDKENTSRKHVRSP